MDEIILIPDARYIMIDRVRRDYFYVGLFQEQHGDSYTFVRVEYVHPGTKSRQYFDSMKFSSTTYDFILDFDIIVDQLYIIKPKVQTEYYYLGYYQESDNPYLYTFNNVTYLHNNDLNAIQDLGIRTFDARTYDIIVSPIISDGRLVYKKNRKRKRKKSGSRKSKRSNKKKSLRKK